MHTSFLKNQEIFDLDHWKTSADFYTQSMYSWLPSIKGKTGKTYCLMDLAWPNDNLINLVPLDYDTYVLSFQFEYVDLLWIRKFCNHVQDRTVLLICPFGNFVHDILNLKVIEFQGWAHVIDWYQTEYIWPDVDFDSKKKKISALANRVNQSRTYVCAYIYKNWNPLDYVLSWHGSVTKDEDWFLLNYTGNNTIDLLVDYIKSEFKHLILKPDSSFENNTPLDNLNYNWSAYTDCLVNFTNESVNNSFIIENDSEIIMPGPYLTEKTFKCLLSRTALVPVGQYNTYQYLEELGFIFDYPWSKNFDLVPYNITRFEQIIQVLDQIQQLDFIEIKQKIKSSCDHNREHIISGNFFKKVDHKNKQNINQFLDTY